MTDYCSPEAMIDLLKKQVKLEQDALRIVQEASIAHAGRQNARVAALEAAINDHNTGCESSCGRSNKYNANIYGCESYLSRGMQCPNCPMDDLIDMPVTLETKGNDHEI